MSTIYFDTLLDSASVRGSERAMFGIMCSNLTYAFFDSEASEHFGETSILRNLFPTDHYIHNSNNFARDFGLQLTLGSRFLTLAQEEISTFSLCLNTAFLMGTDFIKLAARIHGQCEVHGYIGQQNKPWLSQIIQEGLSCGFYRQDSGWESLVDLLQNGEDSPVIMSYSVCQRFPHSNLVKPQTVGDYTVDFDMWWESLEYKQQWDLCFAALRKQHRLELTPDDWQGFYFEDGYNAVNLLTKVRNIYGEQNDCTI